MAPVNLVILASELREGVKPSGNWLTLLGKYYLLCLSESLAMDKKVMPDSRRKQ